MYFPRKNVKAKKAVNMAAQTAGYYDEEQRRRPLFFFIAYSLIGVWLLKFRHIICILFRKNFSVFLFAQNAYRSKFG